MDKAKEQIVVKGETLRELYLLHKIGAEMNKNIVADEINIKKSLSPLFKEVEKLIPLLERETPEWAKQLARKNYDNRSGFVIWEEEEI